MILSARSIVVGKTMYGGHLHMIHVYDLQCQDSMLGSSDISFWDHMRLLYGPYP
jgi:hypothetical protein